MALLVTLSLDGLAAKPGVSTGSWHSLAVGTDGKVRVWGDDSYGQLGLGRAVSSPNAIPVNGLIDVVSISAGDRHALAIGADGTVWSWGSNSVGQLGDGTFLDRTIPVRVVGLTDVRMVSAGRDVSIALKRDGTVWAWGGLSDVGTSSGKVSTPAPIIGLNGATSIWAGALHTLFLQGDGTLWQWGNSGRSSPVQVAGISQPIAVAAGPDYSLAVKPDGTVWRWLRASYGTPARVDGLSSVVAVTASMSHSVALTSDGTVWTWGSNSAGQLGDGTTTDRAAPAPVNGLTGITTISSGAASSFARKVDGTVWGWGRLAQVFRTTPTTVSGLSGALNVSSGATGDFAIALTSNGTVWAWGDNSYGQLADGSLRIRTTPAEVSGLGEVVAVAGGGLFESSFSLALKDDGTVWSWGANAFGQLGNGTTSRSSSPVLVGGLTGAIAISGGEQFSLALKADGTVWSWGVNFRGRLGDGSTASFRSRPVQVVGLAGIVAISAGSGHSLVLSNDGSVWGWGRNNNGQIGDGTTTDRNVPVRLATLSGAIAVSAGEEHSLALTADGRVWTWGYNTVGQLGLGNSSPQPAPASVPGLAGVISVSAGNLFSLAKKSDGSIWHWGVRVVESGLNVQVPPAQIPGLDSVAEVSSIRFRHALFLKQDGTVSAWGNNQYGQLGDGTFATRSSPTVVRREDGLGSIAGNDWFLDLEPSTLSAVAAPPFLVVASGVGTDIDAELFVRQQDVGTTASTYIYALAPASLVKASADGLSPLYIGKAYSSVTSKDTPVPCVLAQLNASGQLQAVSASSIQAYVTGVLSAQGQAVNVISGVPAVNIGGATFYVGYGPNSSAMLNSGLNRSVVTIPSDRLCVPQPPQKGWWWNPSESGRGFSIEARGSNLFMASYLYDVSGRATWHVAAGPTSLDGSVFSGRLLTFGGGVTLSGAYRPNAGLADAGPITLAFDDSHHGTLVWPGGAVALQRFDFGSSGTNTAPLANQPESGWWWGGTSDNGRGFFIEWQGNQAFVAGYMYDPEGNPAWYVSQGSVVDPRSYSGTWLQFANGQTLTGPYRAATLVNGSVAPVAIQFQGADTAILGLPSGNLPIQRFRF